MVSIIGLVPILIIVLVVLAIVGAKSEAGQKGGEDVIKNVYIYLVLFATLMMVIGGSVASFMALADIIAPVPYHQTYEDYKRWGGDMYYRDKEGAQEERLSEAELRANYEAMIISHQERQVSRATNTLIKSLGWIIIPLPIFMYYQRRLTKKEATPE